MGAKKKRKEKVNEYNRKYGDTPCDYNERLAWMWDALKMDETKAAEVLYNRDLMLQQLYFLKLNVVLWEVPEGTPRPRFRLINRKNLANMAIANSQFVHVYNITASDNWNYMNKLSTEEELFGLNQLICTPCVVDYYLYLPTPSYYNAVDTYLAEIGMIRPPVKPDWDNAGKTYSDMYNANIWLDDQFTIDGCVHKYYSIKPRVEIKLSYLNMLYNKQQYTQISNRKDFIEKECNVDYYHKGECLEYDGEYVKPTNQ